MHEAAPNPPLRIVEDGASPAAAAPPAMTDARAWRALVWAEWFAHARLLLASLVAWLACVWFLPLVVHPLWILAFGVVYAAVAGPAFGGADVIHGCEEFGFALPATRLQRYGARLLVGGGSLLAFTAMDVVALQGNFADVLLRVFVSSGLPAVTLNQPMPLFGLVVAVPFAVFALGFPMAALASSRAVAFTAWVWGVLGALMVLRGGIQLEELRFDRPNGWFSVPLLAAVSAGSLWIGARRYRAKEAASGGGPLRMPPGWWLALAGLVAAGVGVALLLGWFAATVSRLL